MKKRILMLATGGTIASRESGQGLAPAITSEELLGYVPGVGELCRVETVQLMNLDSTNVGPSHWLSMARAIEARYRDYDGFVVTHGTDTMAYTAAALSYLIQQSPKAIVLTGAQKLSALTARTPRSTLRSIPLRVGGHAGSLHCFQQSGHPGHPGQKDPDQELSGLFQHQLPRSGCAAGRGAAALYPPGLRRYAGLLRRTRHPRGTFEADSRRGPRSGRFPAGAE